MIPTECIRESDRYQARPGQQVVKAAARVLGGTRRRRSVSYSPSTLRFCRCFKRHFAAYLLAKLEDYVIEANLASAPLPGR